MIWVGPDRAKLDSRPTLRSNAAIALLVAIRSSWRNSVATIRALADPAG